MDEREIEAAERRAEIEAVEVLGEIHRRTTPQGDAGNRVAHELSGGYLAALDRVRDARGDEAHLSDKARAMIVSRQVMGDDDAR